MQRIIVMNSKGGCGKTTIATNLASYYASKGLNTALFDYDPQGSSTEWLRQRSVDMPDIYGVVGYRTRTAQSSTQAWKLKVPLDTQRIVLDMPGGIKAHELSAHVKNINAVIIPVLPSSIDMAATARFVRELIFATRLRRNKTPVFFVGNRVHQHANTFHKLEAFLDDMSIPVAANFKDSLDYVRAAETGIGIHEMTCQSVQHERASWDEMIGKIDAALKSPSTHAALYG
ncbi:MAG: AAA family ATPase [Gammaproteobacteria bacterium]|nr:AAA family ATPase [Gammaproteobacteria bacterium]